MYLSRELIRALATASGRPEHWRDRALCAQADPEMFFPSKGKPARPAKRICQACEVRAECLDYALQAGEEHGIWGGLTTGQPAPGPGPGTEGSQAA